MSSNEASFECDFAVEADLLAADYTNPYLIDAAGYLRMSQSMINGERYPDSAARAAASVLRTVGDYAVNSDNAILAEQVFDREDLAGKYRLYGMATVGGTIDRHSSWVLRLETDEVQSELAQDQAAATELLIAGIRFTLAEYASARFTASKERALAAAVDYKARLDPISFWRRGKQAEFAKPINMGQAEAFTETVDILFAERGLWQEVGTSRPGYSIPSAEKESQLIAKAGVGELTRRDRFRLRRDWSLSTLVAVDTMAKGKEMPPRDYPYRDHLIGNRLLAAAAPEIYVHFGLARKEQLDVLLKANGAEQVARLFLNMQTYGKAPELLRAALMMAPHYEQLLAVQGAYGVYRKAVAAKMVAVGDYTAQIDWRNEHPKEVAAMQPIVQELGHEVYVLEDPIDAVLASVKQLAIATEVDPASNESSSALYHLRDSWDNLERMESYSGRLPELAALIKSQGIKFVCEWKHFSSQNGYIGYGLVDPRIVQAQPEDDSEFVDPHKLADLREATQRINELHGEDRFVLIELPETRQGDDRGERTYETWQRIRIAGNWRERGLRRWELTTAESVAGWDRKSFNTLLHMTDRLMALQLADD